jgi:short-subunit dehydrogenase
MKKLFKNKVVLITGASSGLGKALAYEFAKNGANVILLARRFEIISSIAEDLTYKFNKCIAIKCDVSKDGDLENAVVEGLKIFKKIDIVIANAGFGIGGNFEDIKIEGYRKQFETNIFGVLRTIYATLPELKKTKGSICIIGSVNGAVSFSTGVSAYVMSKFALRGLVQSLSLELLPYEISVTHAMPGFMKTEFHKDDQETERKISWLEISPERASHIILKAIKKKKFEIIITNHGKIAVYMERYTPFILRKLSKLFSKIK